MNIFKKSFTKIALSILLAVLTVVLCIFVSGYTSQQAIAETEAEPTAMSTIHLSADKTELTAGDTFTLTIDISTKRTDLKWSSFYFDLVPLDGGKVVNSLIPYFEFVSRTANGNIQMGNGSLGISALYTGNLSSSKHFSIKAVIKVKEDAPDMHSIDYGISPRNSNITLYDADSKELFKYSSTNPEQMATNSIQMSIKAAPTSSIHLSADKTELTAGEEFTLTIEISSTRKDVEYYHAMFDLDFMNIVGNSSDGLVKSNFELVSFGCNFEDLFGESDFFEKDDFGENALRIICFDFGGEVLSNQKIIITIDLKVKENAKPVQSFDFGIAPYFFNYVAFINGDREEFVDKADNPELLEVNSIPMSIKATENSTVQLSSNKTELTAGDYFVLSVEISTTRTDLNWSAVDLVVGSLDDEGNSPSTTISPYFEYVSHTTNLDVGDICIPDFDNASAGHNQGLHIMMVLSSNDIPCTQKIVFAIILRVKDDAPTVENFDFGIASIGENYLYFSDGTKDAANMSLTTNTIPMSIKAA